MPPQASGSVELEAPRLDSPAHEGCYGLAVPVRRVAEPLPPLKVAFGRAVQALRTRVGYSVEQLGARAGLRPTDIAAIEQGDRNLPLVTIERLAHALGVRVSELLAEAERRRIF